MVVAWKPSQVDLERLSNGASVFLMVIGGLPPHIMGTDFKEVTQL